HDPNNVNSIDHNQIKSIYTDPNGLIWVGTLNGQLNKYNPVTDSFERIKLPQADLMSSNQAEIKVITSDLNNNLWIGTLKNGLFKVPVINGTANTSKTEHFKKNDDIPNSISTNSVTSIYIDNEENIWLGTINGLDKYDPKSGRFLNYTFNIRDPKAPVLENDNAVFSI